MTQDQRLQFARLYLDSLLALEPADVQRSPCLSCGRGGVAYALLREALTLRRSAGRTALLALAARWARAAIITASSFKLRGWPKASYSRGLSGLHAVTARIAIARDDPRGAARAISQFLAASRRARGSLDLHSGAAGRLAGAAALVELQRDPQIFVHGDALARRLAATLARGDATIEPVGIAHGMPGIALGLLQWQRVAPSTERAVTIARYLQRLRWQPTMTGWAHGSAGLALLLARAYGELGDPELLARARVAGEHAAAGTGLHPGLVWGAPGIAYCLLALADVDPAGAWTERATALTAATLANLVVPDADPYGVWSGLSGLFCLVHDLGEARHRFPLIEA